MTFAYDITLIKVAKIIEAKHISRIALPCRRYEHVDERKEKKRNKKKKKRKPGKRGRGGGSWQKPKGKSGSQRGRTTWKNKRRQTFRIYTGRHLCSFGSSEHVTGSKVVYQNVTKA